MRSFEVRVAGGGPPLVLVPGAACGPVVWEPLIERLASRWELHLVSISGFAGRPAIPPPLLSTLRDELAEHVCGLKGPALVGHSLGAFEVLWVAATVPDRVRAVVALDGVPAFGALQMPGASTDRIARLAAERRDSLLRASPEEFVAINERSFVQMTRDPLDAELITRTGNLSDQRAVAEAMFELWTTDIRDLMADIRAPVLLAVPMPEGLSPGARAQRLARHASQVRTIPEHRVEPLDGSRHMVTFDAPDRVTDLVERFVGSTKP